MDRERDVPTIIIGLGGIGSEIVVQTERQMQSKDGLRKYGDYKRSNVRFVIMDTDINSIREREEEGYRGYSVRMSDNISVGRCLEDEDTSSDWFPYNMKYCRKSISEGAGQVRSISRLALHRAIRTGKLKPLYKAIEDLYKTCRKMKEQELKIAMVSTIAGGTGSGAILPLGMHIKDYLNRKYSGAGAKINAFLILPDVLDDVIFSKEEKKNLNANSYAAVKEIDAFINGNEGERYIKLPNENNDDIERFTENPFDFCFLFNKLSCGKGLYDGIQDYKDNISRCLYTQFLGTLAPEYFSKEDNVNASHVRELPNGTFHCERFASAGCAVVRYPVEEIREYLALCWMSDVMKDEWIKYDEERKEIQKKNREKLELGETVSLPSEGSMFLEAVEAVDKHEKEKQNAVQTCGEKLDKNCGRSEGKGMWEELGIAVRRRIQEERGGLTQQIQDMKEVVGHLKQKERKEYLNVCMNLEAELLEENQRIYAKLSGGLDREFCRVHMGEAEPCHLEFYLKNDQGEFESPNFIRFALYKLEAEGEMKKGELEQKEESLDRQIRSELERAKEPAGKLNKRNMEYRINNQCEIYESMCELLEVRLERHCVSELLGHIRRISEGYERFFREYSGLLMQIAHRKTEMENRFKERMLKMEHWVYADTVHLQAMLERMKQKKEYHAVGGDISEWLYRECFRKGRSGIYDDTEAQYKLVKKKWVNQFDRYFLHQISMNVMEALREEARDMSGQVDFAHMRKRLEEARDAASVLISSCRRPDIVMRKYCIYPRSLLQVDECGEIIKEFLQNRMAFGDFDGLDVDDTRLIFFEIGYGFLPSDVDFFAGDPGLYAKYPEGDGKKAYRWVVKNLRSEDKCALATPHIDKRWYKDKYMLMDWGARVYSTCCEAVVWFLYRKVLTEEQDKDSKKAGLKEWICEQYNLYCDQEQKENDHEMREAIRREAKFLGDSWAKCQDEKQKEQLVNEQIQKVDLVRKTLLEKWCNSRQEEEYYSKKMSESFQDLLESLKTEATGAWVDKVVDEWNKRCRYNNG